jgi:hypothetical protein
MSRKPPAPECYQEGELGNATVRESQKKMQRVGASASALAGRKEISQPMEQVFLGLPALHARMRPESSA